MEQPRDQRPWWSQPASAMQLVGGPVVFESLDGAGHVPWTQYSSLFETQWVNFFYRYLDEAHAAH